MELEKYIKEVGKLMPISINLLTDLQATGSKYDFATGSQEYPTTIKETFKRIKELLCQKK
tara:strand:- start:170 stop:349 length:180 start_codon:yes stop_codon:yes gene_type:complete